jgi:hypothetical protein
LEARVGIEPTHKGFADLSLTTWVPRPDVSKRLSRHRKPSPAARVYHKKLEEAGAGDGI